MKYQSSFYTDACTSPLYIFEISVFLIHRRIYLADVHRRDISLPYMQTHLPRRCTSARYQSSLYTDAPTSPLYIDEIQVFVIYRRTYLAVEHRRDISLSYIQTHVLRRCTSARYQSSSYTDASTSPMFTGEISAFLIYRHMYLAVVHRRGGGSILDNLLNNTYCELKLANFVSFYTLKQSHNMCLFDHRNMKQLIHG